MKKGGVVVLVLIVILVIVFVACKFYKPQDKNPPSYVLHEWGVLLGDSARTNPLVDYRAYAAKPIIYLYSEDNFNLSLSVDFENGNAIEVWPYISTGKKISWNNFRIYSYCNTTPFPEPGWEMKEIYELGNYIVDDASCIDYNNTKSKVLFYNGVIDYGNSVTGYYIDLGDSKQITLTNNLEQNISDIYINYKEPSKSRDYGVDLNENISLGILKISRLDAGETKTFAMNVSTFNFSDIPLAWTNQAKEFKQKLINDGLYTNEATKFMIAWEDTFFGIQGPFSYVDYQNGMNILYILPEEKYNQLFKLEVSIEPKEIKRIGVVYSPIEESAPLDASTSAGSATINENNCDIYTNQMKTYCNPFSSAYNKEICNKSEEDYSKNNCCES